MADARGNAAAAPAPGADVVAADVVVDPAGSRSDVTTIVAAIAALPAGGGTIYLHAGTYSLSSTVTMPDKDVRIIGSGRGATVIDIESNAIAAFTIANDREYAFEGFTILGDSAVTGQSAFLFSGSSTKLASFKDIVVGDVGTNLALLERTFATDTGESRLIHARNLVTRPTGGTARALSDVSGTLRLDDCVAEVNASILGSPTVLANNCRIGQSATSTLGPDCSFSGCTFEGSSPFTVGSGSTFTGCRFEGTRTLNAAASASDITVTGCLFDSTALTHILTTTAITRLVVTGCVFQNFGTQAINLLFSTDCSVDGCVGALVTESGTASGNRYSNNQGFDGSTIIGADSVIDDWNTRTVTTTPVTLDRDDRTVLVDSSGGNRTINLPTAASARYQVYRIKKIAAANTVTIDASGAETIDGELTRDLVSEFDEITIQSDGTEWHILSYYLIETDNFEWHPTVSQPAPSRVGAGASAGFELVDNLTRGIIATVRAPNDFDTGFNPIVRIPYWVSVVGAATADVRMRLTVRYIADGELVSKAADETLLQTVSVTNTLDRQDEMSFTLTASLIARADKINFFLERLGGDGADTFTGDIAITEDASRLDYRRG